MDYRSWFTFAAAVGISRRSFNVISDQRDANPECYLLLNKAPMWASPIISPRLNVDYTLQSPEKKFLQKRVIFSIFDAISVAISVPPNILSINQEISLNFLSEILLIYSPEYLGTLLVLSNRNRLSSGSKLMTFLGFSKSKINQQPHFDHPPEPANSSPTIF